MGVFGVQTHSSHPCATLLISACAARAGLPYGRIARRSLQHARCARTTPTQQQTTRAAPPQRARTRAGAILHAQHRATMRSISRALCAR
eukprot:8176304-Lingulodinium_polyedra.AAC.1